MSANVTGQELSLVLGAYSAFVLAAFGVLIKFVLDARREASATNRAVNSRPEGEPSLYVMVRETRDTLAAHTAVLSAHASTLNLHEYRLNKAEEKP